MDEIHRLKHSLNEVWGSWMILQFSAGYTTFRFIITDQQNGDVYVFFALLFWLMLVWEIRLITSGLLELLWLSFLCLVGMTVGGVEAVQHDIPDINPWIALLFTSMMILVFKVSLLHYENHDSLAP